MNKGMNICEKCGNRTNADRIKSMDSAELAGFLLEIFECGLITGEEMSQCDVDDCEFKFCNNGEKEYKEWLESEVEK